MRLRSKKKDSNSSDTQVIQEGTNYNLYFKINANRAADLVQKADTDSVDESGTATSSSTSSRKNVNPVLVAVLNNVKKKTKRKVNTSQPSWDATLQFPLKTRDCSQVFSLTVWDKHKRYKNYLGELRLNLNDIFYKDGKFQSKSDLKWYNLYSNKEYHSFVTGSLLLSFELEVKKRKQRKSKKTKEQVQTPSQTPNPETTSEFDTLNADSSSPGIVVKVVPPSRKASGNLHKKVDSLSLSDTEAAIPITIEENKEKLFLEWKKLLIYSDPDSSITKPDEQGFYSDTGEVLSLLADLSDIESISSTSASNPDARESPDLQHSPISSLRNQKFLTVGADDLSSMSDGSLFSSDSAMNYESDALSNDNAAKGILNLGSELSKPKRNFGFKRLKRKKDKEQFNLSKRAVLGVLFLEIVSCSDLPPNKSFNRATFDMDPFVVVTFGKKTFRSSWKRHTLNPIFNERLAFEILPHESNFNIQFFVLDKDQFSYNDNVANLSLRMKDITNMATAPPATTFENKHLSPSSFSLLPNALDAALSTGENDSQNSSIRIVDDDNMVHSVRKKKFTNRKKVTVLRADTSRFKTMNLTLDLHKSKNIGKYNPTLKIRVRFEPYESLRRQLWGILLEQYELNETENKYDFIELISFLDTLGCENSDQIVSKFFDKYKRLAWGGDLLSIDEIIDALEDHVKFSTGIDDKLFDIEKCPLCCQKRLSKKQDFDIITHVAICASKDWSIVNKLLVSSYVTPQIATKRWFTKILIKLTYGKYTLGSNSANILVQDRTTGIILEEKMGIYVRLGIRLLYKGFDKAKSRRIRQVLRKLSIKQGTKFDSPQLKNDIESFVKFHKLDLSQCLEPNLDKYGTFNEFFYRKLKPDARPNESPNDNRVVVSPADCRCTAFATVKQATEVWVKGRNFTIAKLFNGNFNNLQETDLYKAECCSLGIFRLAPQDYHRFHSPVDGVIKNIKYIDGEYYTVNPMAIRSELDVFGENVRAIIPIETKEFGTVIMVAVGAMMVGSIVLTQNENDEVKRGDEIGYFKFGGSTILLLFNNKVFKFDSDLVNNSNTSVETLIRVGESIGHAPEIEEYKRDHIDFGAQSKDFKLNLIRALTGGDLSTSQELSNWESTHTNIEDLVDVVKEEDIIEDDEDEDLEEEGLFYSNESDAYDL
mmetsp:Transcript_5262/g.5986  ORF Transcript_5262/g.5986 Transcript_5262/m.5986 type:complete len:1161 (-) Transcript_5262:38-3520(-)